MDTAVCWFQWIFNWQTTLFILSKQCMMNIVKYRHWQQHDTLNTTYRLGQHVRYYHYHQILLFSEWNVPSNKQKMDYSKFSAQADVTYYSPSKNKLTSATFDRGPAINALPSIYLNYNASTYRGKITELKNVQESTTEALTLKVSCDTLCSMLC